MPLFPAYYAVVCRTIAAAWMLAHRNRTLTQWHAQYHDRLVSTAYRYVGPDAAEDFANDAWLIATRRFHEYRPELSSPATWLTQQLRGAIRNEHMRETTEVAPGERKRRVVPMGDDLDPATVVDYDYFAQWAAAYRSRTKGEVAIMTTADRATKDKRYRLRRKVRREARQDRPSPL